MRHPEVYIRVKLRSEAIFDSGEQAANHVHTQALADEYGFVYYHAKTFKGQLKRQAYWLHDLYRESGEEKAARAFVETVADLFGFHGEEERAHNVQGVRWRNGMMRLGNLQLPSSVQDKLRGWLQRENQERAGGYVHFSPQDLLEAQTNVRTMIQMSNGTADERMFTLFHTVKEGLTFESAVEFDINPEERHLQQLLRIVRSLDRIGARVNRGRGLVAATLWINGRRVDKPDEIKTAFQERNTAECMNSAKPQRQPVHAASQNGNPATLYYVVEIRNEEPLKIGAVGSKSNWSEASKMHIPGSTIRGALVRKLIKQDLFSPDEVDVLHNVHCQSGYLYRGDHLFLPAPQHLRVDKHLYRQEKANERRSPVSLSVYGKDKAPSAKNHLPSRYVSIDEGPGGSLLIGDSAQRAYRLHHSTVRRPGEQERENLYNYQAIASGHTFRAIVMYQGERGDRLDQVLPVDSTQVWQLGGARSAGYGRCIVKVLQRCETYDEAAVSAGFRRPRKLSGQTLSVTCLTDCLFRDHFGQPAPGIPDNTVAAWIANLLPETRENPIRVNSQRLYLQTGMSEGYNATWDARYPKETVVLAGSVMQYELSRALSEEQWRKLIQGLEAVPHGSRTQEGFGWLLVNVDYPNRLSTGDGRDKVQEQAAVLADTERHSFVLDEREEQHTIWIIRTALYEGRDQWLGVLADRLRGLTEESEGSQNLPERRLHLSSALRRVHLQRMLGRLQAWLRQHGRKLAMIPQDFDKKLPDTFSVYEQDAKWFSFAGVHFQGLMSYLQSDSEHEKLKSLASHHLVSTKGQFYYSMDNAEDVAERFFIAELLAVTLYLASREWKGAQND